MSSGVPWQTIVPPPEPPQGGPNERDGHFTPETPFSTRYFVLRYEDNGTLVLADLSKIASVTDADTAEYLTAALKNGEGYGRCGSYRFFVAHTGDDQNMAIFLDSYQQFRAIRLLLLWSLLADVGCTLLVLLLVFAAAASCFEWLFPWAASTIPMLQEMSNYTAI